MNMKTMEGLVGAHTSMKLADTPMSVYRKEAAKRDGDAEVMKRAVGYADDLTEQSKEYSKKADEGMTEEARQIREERKVEAEKEIQKTESDKQDTNVQTENAVNQGDSADISIQGQNLLNNASNSKPVKQYSDENSIYTSSGTTDVISTDDNKTQLFI